MERVVLDVLPVAVDRKAHDVRVAPVRRDINLVTRVLVAAEDLVLVLVVLPRVLGREVEQRQRTPVERDLDRVLVEVHQVEPADEALDERRIVGVHTLVAAQEIGTALQVRVLDPSDEVVELRVLVLGEELVLLAVVVVGAALEVAVDVVPAEADAVTACDLPVRVEADVVAREAEVLAFAGTAAAVDRRQTRNEAGLAADVAEELELARLVLAPVVVVIEARVEVRHRHRGERRGERLVDHLAVERVLGRLRRREHRLAADDTVQRGHREIRVALHLLPGIACRERRVHRQLAERRVGGDALRLVLRREPRRVDPVREERVRPCQRLIGVVELARRPREREVHRLRVVAALDAGRVGSPVDRCDEVDEAVARARAVRRGEKLRALGLHAVAVDAEVPRRQSLPFEEAAGVLALVIDVEVVPVGDVRPRERRAQIGAAETAVRRQRVVDEAVAQPVGVDAALPQVVLTSAQADVHVVAAEVLHEEIGPAVVRAVARAQVDHLDRAAGQVAILLGAGALVVGVDVAAETAEADRAGHLRVARLHLRERRRRSEQAGDNDGK